MPPTHTPTASPHDAHGHDTLDASDAHSADDDAGLAHAGHDHAGHDHAGHAEVFRRRFWGSLFLAVPVIATSEMVQDWFGYHLDVPGVTAVPPVLGTILYLTGGRPFLSGGVSELRGRRPGMMLLIAVAITVAFGASLAATAGIGDLDFWWELAALIVVMLLGHWLEMRAIGQASGALAALAALLPDRAERVERDGSVTAVPIAALRVGDLVLVRPGGRVPADGTIADGSAHVDESMVTGESRPALRDTGDRVVAGTVSTDSAIRIRVDAVGDDTALAGIQRLVADAQASRSRVQVLADRAAAVLFHLAMTTAVLAMVAWSIAGHPADGIVAAVTVLVIACPHALGLAIPLVVAISTSVSARSGILVKDRLALERMRSVDVVLFDKTGTLTRGSHVVVDAATTATVDVADVLTNAASVEAQSEHPVARAIVAALPAGRALAAVDAFRSTPGLGVSGTVDGAQVEVGGPRLLAERGLTEPDDLTAVSAAWRDRGDAVLHVVVDGRITGAIALADQVRPEAADAVAALQRRGVRVAMITGDASEVAHAVAAELGIDEVHAQVRPADKESTVAALQARGHRVAMIGDGVNDAPALARADVGLAIGAGTDVAIESAGVVLAGDDPRAVVGVIDLSRAASRKMAQNLAWATAYNLGSLPVAAGAFAFAGVSIPPALAAVAMSVSTIVVAFNAQLLRRVDVRSGWRR